MLVVEGVRGVVCLHVGKLILVGRGHDLVSLLLDLVAIDGGAEVLHAGLVVSTGLSTLGNLLDALEGIIVGLHEADRVSVLVFAQHFY